jgi:primosomal protein N' (replication factor Y)
MFVEFFAKVYGANLIVADSVLRTETLFRIEEQEIIPYRSFQNSFREAEAVVVDMRKDATGNPRAFSIISPELKQFIEEALAENERIFLFSGRRGLSPLTVCNDCGTIVECLRCHGPTSLHTGNPKNYFLCHRCGEKRNADELCKNCGSWKLQTLGIGVERVADELKKLFPKTPLFRMDKDSVTTEKKAKDTIEKYLETPGAILLGTELARHYLNAQVGYTAVISIDSLFAVPDFRINDRIFSLLLSLRELARRKTLYQTRNIESSLFKYAAEGTIGSFYKEEIEARTIFTYPPLSTMIKVAYEGTEREGTKAMEALQKILSRYEPALFPASFATKGGKVIRNMLLKLPRGSWPDVDLKNILASLQTPFKVEVDPESLL